MNCSYHPNTTAAAGCSACARNLCPACDHRIKGQAYCQDCIVAGVAALRRGAAQGGAGKSGRSPWMATLFGLIPGLGAAYNGQHVKALVHFAVTVGLWQLADIFHRGLEMTFALAGAAFYLYSLHDAFRAAQRRRAGEDLHEEDERLKGQLREHTHLWGGALVGVGLLSALDLFLPFQVDRFWPVLLIIVGLYFLRDLHRHRGETLPPHSFSAPPPSVIAPSFERTGGDYARTDNRR